jgi:hypothetical protein
VKNAGTEINNKKKKINVCIIKENHCVKNVGVVPYVNIIGKKQLVKNVGVVTYVCIIKENQHVKNVISSYI